MDTVGLVVPLLTPPPLRGDVQGPLETGTVTLELLRRTDGSKGLDPLSPAPKRRKSRGPFEVNLETCQYQSLKWGRQSFPGGFECPSPPTNSSTLYHPTPHPHPQSPHKIGGGSSSSGWSGPTPGVSRPRLRVEVFDTYHPGTRKKNRSPGYSHCVPKYFCPR